MQHHQSALDALPSGTAVIIDIGTGAFVTGSTPEEADAAFRRQFGLEERPSYSFEIGRPIFIGGGLWRR